MGSFFVNQMLASFIFLAFLHTPPIGADLAEVQPFDMTACGRSFTLGMLYDQKSDKLISGATLWDASQIKANLNVAPFTHTSISVEASDSLESRYNLMDISMQMKVSMLGGLIDISGSAKYLQNEKKSVRQSRITLKYSATTRFASMNMDILSNLTYNNEFEEFRKTATHVVTGIIYGADAYFDFEAMAGENDDIKQIAGTLDVAVKTMPSFQIEGNGQIAIDATEAKKYEGFSFKMFTDFDLSNKSNAVSYQDAVKLYKELPLLLGPKGERAVPKRVYFFPIHRLDSKATKLSRDISSNLIDDIMELMQSAEDLNSQANDIRNTKSARLVGFLGNQLTMFQRQKIIFVNRFVQIIGPILPTVRAGGQEESVLAAIIKRWYTSPFSPNIGKAWLAKKAVETAYLDSLLASMGQVKLETNIGEVFRFTITKEHVIVLELSLPDKDDYLDLFSAYNDAVGSNNNVATTTTTWNPKMTWYNDPAVNEKIQPLISSFRTFAQTNVRFESTQFVMVIVPTVNDTAASARIRYYRSSKEIPNFKLPSSQPTNFKATLSGDNVMLTWNFQDSEWITGFQVSYTATSGGNDQFLVPKSSGTSSVNGTMSSIGKTFQLPKQDMFTFEVVSLMDFGSSPSSTSQTINAMKKGSLHSCNNSLVGYDLGVDPGFRGYGDVNGDGWPDYCRVIGGGALSCHLGGADYLYSFNSRGIDTGKPRMCEGLFDVNNDGRADFCRVLKSATNKTLTCLLAGQKGFTDIEKNFY